MKRLELIGKKFNNLIVVDFSHVSNGNSYWKCTCVCGGYTIVSACSLKNGDTKSCGCLKVFKHKQGMTGLNALFKIYKNQAEKRGYAFELSIEEFKTITLENCFYCGLKPEFISPSPAVYQKIKDSKTQHRSYIYNGIDRINNNYGYIKNNVVPCCKWCNIGKGTKTVDEFKNHIVKIYKHLNLV